MNRANKFLQSDQIVLSCLLQKAQKARQYASAAEERRYVYPPPIPKQDSKLHDPMSDEFEIRLSPLSQSISSGGKTVKVDIYEDGQGGWILEVVDEFNNSTVWDESFATDREALVEAKRTILAEGVRSLVGPESGKGEWR